MTKNSFFEKKILPYRLILWTAMLLYGASQLVWDPKRDIFPYGDVINNECPMPDMCFFGYTPKQILEWYQAIGNEGRSRYGMIAFMDTVIMMPLYSLFLGTEIYISSFSNDIFFFVPFVAVLFDLVETLTHGYAVVMFPDHLPGEMWLKIASVATIIKFIFIAIALILTVTNLIQRVVILGKKETKSN
eukprot:CAMPEP_0194250144 /NCGR_PEP_ID=MMETSP0158-20130606/22267_1 /TAXON_ID=33649 /ORGANISM="Thalassionema nitzschioides, Strain L26-B" /LENGTH=187 /DNA_ID=CAMNT_0038986841 /DNA_START=55 /DNA_END=615 /DNA_ORIENTATION=-